MSSQEKRLKCEVDFKESSQTGTYANAFRIVDDSGVDCFLDFLVYSAEEEKAYLVSRIRVRQQFLSSIRDRLNRVLTEVGQEDPLLWILGDSATTNIH